MIRVKVKTNRFLNLFVSIENSKNIEELSERILQCVYQLGNQNVSLPPKEKNMTVLGLNFRGFFISKDENVGNILKDGDEIECIFSRAKLKTSVCSSVKNINKLEDKQTKIMNNFNEIKSSIDINNMNNKDFSLDKKLNKKTRKRNKLKSKQKKKMELKKENNEIKMCKTQHLNTSAIKKSQSTIKNEMKVEQKTKKVNNIKCKNERDQIKEQESELEKSKKDVYSFSKGQECEEEKSKTSKNDKQTEVEISHSSNDTSKKVNQTKNDTPSQENKSMKKANFIEHTKENDIMELCSQTGTQIENNIKKVCDEEVKHDQERNLVKHEDSETKELSNIWEMTENNVSEEIEKNEKLEKVEILFANEKKPEGIIYCYQKEKENDETSKTFIETDSQTDSLDLTSSFGDPVSESKQMTFQRKSEILAALKTKHSKNIVKYEEKF